MKRWNLSLILACAIALASVLVMAQDPITVGPDIYKKLFENERIRVIEVTFKPGAKMGLHSHPDHFVYALTEGKLIISKPDGTSQVVEGKPGLYFWIGAESHQAENIGTTEFKLLVTELKEPAPKPTKSAEAKPAGK